MSARVDVFPPSAASSTSSGIWRAPRLAVLPREIPSGFPIKLINYLSAGLPVVACEGSTQMLGRQSGVIAIDNGNLPKAMAYAIDRSAGRCPPH